MTGSTYNRLVAAAARNQPLRGTRRDTGGGTLSHHWRVTTAPDTTPGRWRIYTGVGTVNDRPAAISYLRQDDPRGWVMPKDHPAIPLMTRLYGPDFRFIDRSLTEYIDPPYQLATSPSADGADLGDFSRVPDLDRIPLYFFRTKPMWDLDLYTASLFVTAAPVRYSRTENSLRIPITPQNTRFRMALAPRLPAVVTGTADGGRWEIARLYLTRAKSDPRTDQLYVQQRTFWDLWTMNINPSIFGSDSDAFALSKSLATGNIVLDSITDTLLQAIAALLEGASSVQFWSAA